MFEGRAQRIAVGLAALSGLSLVAWHAGHPGWHGPPRGEGFEGGPGCPYLAEQVAKLEPFVHRVEHAVGLLTDCEAFAARVLREGTPVYLGNATALRTGRSEDFLSACREWKFSAVELRHAFASEGEPAHLVHAVGYSTCPMTGNLVRKHLMLKAAPEGDGPPHHPPPLKSVEIVTGKCEANLATSSAADVPGTDLAAALVKHFHAGECDAVGEMMTDDVAFQLASKPKHGKHGPPHGGPPHDGPPHGHWHRHEDEEGKEHWHQHEHGDEDHEHEHWHRHHEHEDEPASEDKDWVELTAAEQHAAEVLGYDQNMWDKDEEAEHWHRHHGGKGEHGHWHHRHHDHEDGEEHEHRHHGHHHEHEDGEEHEHRHHHEHEDGEEHGHRHHHEHGPHHHEHGHDHEHGPPHRRLRARGPPPRLGHDAPAFHGREEVVGMCHKVAEMLKHEKLAFLDLDAATVTKAPDGKTRTTVVMGKSSQSSYSPKIRRGHVAMDLDWDGGKIARLAYYDTDAVHLVEKYGGKHRRGPGGEGPPPPPGAWGPPPPPPEEYVPEPKKRASVFGPEVVGIKERCMTRLGQLKEEGKAKDSEDVQRLMTRCAGGFAGTGAADEEEARGWVQEMVKFIYSGEAKEAKEQKTYSDEVGKVKEGCMKRLEGLKKADQAKDSVRVQMVMKRCAEAFVGTGDAGEEEAHGWVEKMVNYVYSSDEEKAKEKKPYSAEVAKVKEGCMKRLENKKAQGKAKDSEDVQTLVKHCADAFLGTGALAKEEAPEAVAMGWVEKMVAYVYGAKKAVAIEEQDQAFAAKLTKMAGWSSAEVEEAGEEDEDEDDDDEEEEEGEDWSWKENVDWDRVTEVKTKSKELFQAKRFPDTGRFKGGVSARLVGAGVPEEVAEEWVEDWFGD